MRFLAVLATFLLASPAFSTTIAFDGTSIAADSQSTGNSHTKFHSAVPKIIHSDKRHATICAAGDVAITAPIKKFFKETNKPLSECKLPARASEPGSFAILVVFDDGTADYYLGSLDVPTPISAPFAFGSGEDFAMAAMHLGKSAAEAIEVAKSLDLYTGGKTVVINIAKPL